MGKRVKNVLYALYNTGSGTFKKHSSSWDMPGLYATPGLAFAALKLAHGKNVNLTGYVTIEVDFNKLIAEQVNNSAG